MSWESNTGYNPNLLGGRYQANRFVGDDVPKAGSLAYVLCQHPTTHAE